MELHLIGQLIKKKSKHSFIPIHFIVTQMGHFLCHDFFCLIADHFLKSVLYLLFNLLM